MGKREAGQLMAQEFPLSLIIRAVDRATAPLRAINEKIKDVTEPARKLNNSVFELGKASGLFRLTGAFDGVGKAVNGVWKEVKGLGAAFLGAALAAYGLARAISSVANSGNDLRNQSVRLKIPIQTLAEYGYVAKQADISSEEWAASLDDLNKKLGQAKAGTGKLGSLLEMVNPAFLAQLKSAKGNEAALDLLFKALVKLQDPNKRAALASAAFGNEVGKKMANLLENGTKGVEDLRAEFRELAGDQTAFAEAGAKFDEQWKRASTALDGVKNSAAAVILPVLTDMMKQFTAWVSANRAAIAEWVQQFATNLPRYLENAVTILKILAAVMALKVVVAIGSLISSVYALGVALATTPLGWVILALAAIAGLIALVAAHWDEWGPTIKAAFAPAMDAIDELIQVLEPVLMPILNALGEVVGVVLVGAFKVLGAVISGIAKTLTTVVGLFQKVGTFIGETAAKGVLLGEKAMDSVSTGAESVRNFFTGKSETRVVVDFNKMPPGTRVSADPAGTADVDLGLGYAMPEIY